METTPLTDAERVEAKRRICAGLGVTLEEVDLLDRLMHGPEMRAQYDQDRRDLLEQVDLQLADISDDLGEVLGYPVTLVMTDG